MRQAFAICCLAMIGCGEVPKDAPTAPLLPFSGIVNVNGKAAKGASVALHPEAGSSLGVVTPHGTADENGMFLLTTYTHADGVPEGKYKVTVSWSDVITPGTSEPEYGPEKLPRRYQNKDSSGLEIEVRPDMSEATILELKSR